jgi:regulator of extracellular matrix RemA (YlzA/DUF370 family)
MVSERNSIVKRFFKNARDKRVNYDETHGNAPSAILLSGGKPVIQNCREKGLRFIA